MTAVPAPGRARARTASEYVTNPSWTCHGECGATTSCCYAPGGGGGTPASGCPAGYQRTGSKCYKRQSGTFTPATCMASCHAEGATLPCVASEAENNALVTLAGTNGDSCGFTSQRNCVWIGLRQTVTTQGAAANWNVGRLLHLHLPPLAAGRAQRLGRLGRRIGRRELRLHRL